MSQLELIFPNGDIRFLNVEIEKGVVNIGRHPENDIVIDAPGVLASPWVLAGAAVPLALSVTTVAV